MADETYKELLKNPQWQYVRGRILERDKWKCRRCPSVYDLQVHHLRYEKGRMPWQYPDEDLITLCDSCHEKAHGITKSDFGDDMRDPFVRLGQFVRDWKGLVYQMLMKEKQKRQEESQNG